MQTHYAVNAKEKKFCYTEILLQRHVLLRASIERKHADHVYNTNSALNHVIDWPGYSVMQPDCPILNKILKKFAT